MNRISNLKETDFVWLKDLEEAPTTLLVFHQGEMGFASFIAGMGLIGEEEPVCKIFSKMHNVGAFNNIPSPTYPEWRLFERMNEDGRRFLILRLTHAHPLPDSEIGDSTWIYTYPVVRDIITELNQYGVDEMVYLTSNLLQSLSEYDDEYVELSEDEIAIFDYQDPEMSMVTLDGKVIDKQIVLAAPSWTFGSVFQSFSTADEIRGNYIVICGKSKSVIIDRDSADSLLGYAESVLGLNYSEDKVIEYVGIITDLTNMAKSAGANVFNHDSGHDFSHYG